MELKQRFFSSDTEFSLWPQGVRDLSFLLPSIFFKYNEIVKQRCFTMHQSSTVLSAGSKVGLHMLFLHHILIFSLFDSF